MTELTHDQTTLLMTCAGATAKSVADIAAWIRPDAITATSLTLMETTHAMILASAAKAAPPGHTLEDVIEHSVEHLKALTRGFHERMLQTAEEPT